MKQATPIPRHIKMIVRDQMYKQARVNGQVSLHDVVFDTLDNTIGTVICIHPNGTIVVRDEHVVEGNIAPDRLIKLIPMTKWEKLVHGLKTHGLWF